MPGSGSATSRAGAPAAQPTAAGAAPAVAVIMSVHHSVPLPFVREALESVLGQTYPHVQAFALCDGPVRPEVRTYLEDVPAERLRLLEFPENRGLPIALNELLEAVLRAGRFEFVARMDADDVCEPHRIERQVGFMRENPDVGLVGSWCWETDEAGRPVFLKKLPTEHDAMIRFMATRNPIVHSSVLARTTVFARGMRYDPKLRQNQDYDLWSRLAHAGVRIANLPEPLLRFRVDSQFYNRRSGWSRALSEARLKYHHLARFGLRSPRNLLALCALVALRTAPAWAKALAYRKLR